MVKRINFKELCAWLSFEAILAHLQVSAEGRGGTRGGREFYRRLVALAGEHRECGRAHGRLMLDNTGRAHPQGRTRGLAGLAFPDGDPAGERLAESALKLISPHRFVRWVKLTEGKQPTDMSPEELHTLLPLV